MGTKKTWAVHRHTRPTHLHSMQLGGARLLRLLLSLRLILQLLKLVLQQRQLLRLRGRLAGCRLGRGFCRRRLRLLPLPQRRQLPLSFQLLLLQGGRQRA